MRIDELTMYRCNGKLFDSKEKAEGYVFDLVGEFVDNTILADIVLSPSQRIALVQAIWENKTQLSRFL